MAINRFATRFRPAAFQSAATQPGCNGDALVHAPALSEHNTHGRLRSNHSNTINDFDAKTPRLDAISNRKGTDWHFSTRDHLRDLNARRRDMSVVGGIGQPPSEWSALKYGFEPT
ncbi:hypothetical protein, partial [Methylobacterium frigidaeris]